MTRKQIKLLALGSFKKNSLDEKIVNRFSGKMKRSELRNYIKYLKYYESKNSVSIIIPNLNKINQNDLKAIVKLYPNKKIKFLEDKSIILGIKIVDNDLIHDYNLKNTFESITQQI